MLKYRESNINYKIQLQNLIMIYYNLWVYYLMKIIENMNIIDKMQFYILF